VHWRVPEIREIIPVSVDEITVLTILTLVITGTRAMVVVVDVTLEMAILVTVIADTMIGTWEDETEEIEVAEVAEEIGHKVTIHAQFMGGTNGRNVSLSPMGIITGHRMAIPMELARVEEMAQGEVTPTIPIMNQMVEILVEVKGMGSNNHNNTSNNSNDRDRQGGSNNTSNQSNGNNHYLADIGMPDWNQE
jgi:hypothetical protein